MPYYAYRHWDSTRHKSTKSIRCSHCATQCSKDQGEVFNIGDKKLHKAIQSRRVRVDDVQTFLVTLYSSPNSKDGSDTVTVVVESARNLSEIFRALSRYGLWDYLNYYLLQDMIEGFAHDDNELNGMMEQYQKDLTGHILTLKIQTYLDATHDELPLVSTNDSENSDDETIPALPPEQKYKLFKKLRGKIKANVTDHTLNYVVDLWHSLANQFALPQPAMILHDIAEGCIGITWLIPANLVKHIMRMAQETANMFAEEQILTVTLENQCIYPMDTELASDPTLLETEPSRLQNKPRLLETETTALKRKVCCMHERVCERNNYLVTEPSGHGLLLALISEQMFCIPKFVHLAA